jgi:hypothetical protein
MIGLIAERQTHHTLTRMRETTENLGAHPVISEQVNEAQCPRKSTLGKDQENSANALPPPKEGSH